MTPTIQLKRAYDPESAADGYRVYIDRLWPRGLSHRTFHYDAWDKNLAPSAELREWFHQDPAGRWEDFRQRYMAELLANPAFADFKKKLAGYAVVTLLYSSRDRAHNNAQVVEQALSA